MLITVLVICGSSQAAPGGKAARHPASSNDKISRDVVTESEPNNDCASANAVASGDQMEASIESSEDKDYFELTVTAGQSLHIYTILDDGLEDSVIYLFADDCTTQLNYGDDSIGLESAMIYNFATAGTYYVMVEGYSENEVGEYDLAIETITIHPVADTCAEAISIPNGVFELVGSTTGLVDDYNIDLYYGMGGPDAVYGFSLPAGASFDCQAQILGADFIIYLVTDCDDMDESYLDLNDGDPEELSYRNNTAVPQVIYLIVDGYDEEEYGGFVLTGTNEGSGLVSTTASSWGGFKARYR
ncbi:MAG: PPC domain-containing protein, partial [bacterium]